MKRRRMTGQEYKAAKEMARSMTGYDSTSPIWGMRMPAVLQKIGEHLDAAKNPNLTDKERLSDIEAAEVLVTELKKRIATGQIISSQG